MAASLPNSNSLGNLVETGSETNSQSDIKPKDTIHNSCSFNNTISCHSIEDLVCDRRLLYQGITNVVWPDLKQMHDTIFWGEREREREREREERERERREREREILSVICLLTFL